MSALRESRFRGTAQVTVPDGAADAESPKHFVPRPDGPAPAPTASTSTSAPPAPAADPDGAVEAVDATLAVFDNSITSRGFFAARASGSGASRCARASASDNNAARARSGFVFLRRPAEPVQQASRAGGSLVENAQGVDADAEPVHQGMEWER